MRKTYTTNFAAGLTALFLVAATSTSFAQDLTDGLVMHYDFEDNLTENITGQNAETSGTFSYEEGITGQAIKFDFDDNYFLTPEEQLAPGNTPASFALFVKHDASVLNMRRQNYLQQLNGGGETGRATLYLQRPDSPTNPDTIISFVGNGTTSSNYKFTTPDKWFHLGLTIDPVTNERVFYVNGQITNRDTLNKMVEPATGSYVVGHHKGLENHSITLKGLVDDLRFYDRIVTPEEMVMLAGELSGSREQVVNASLQVSPTPARPGQAINFTVDRTVLDASAEIALTIYDGAGRVALERRIARGATNYSLQHDLAPGRYTATLSDGNRLASANLMVVR